MVGPALHATRSRASNPAGWRPGAATSARMRPRSERWWEVFGDPVLVQLVDTAYAENLTLRSAGLRVVQAQARRAITIGALFPQEQRAVGALHAQPAERERAGGALGARDLSVWQAGFDAAWEVDLWGKFRRAIEAADADLLASVASYDDVLVSLVGEVAATYVTIRTLDERLAVAEDNVRVQQESLDIARIRYRGRRHVRSRRPAGIDTAA